MTIQRGAQCRRILWHVWAERRFGKQVVPLGLLLECCSLLLCMTSCRELSRAGLAGVGLGITYLGTRILSLC